MRPGRYSQKITKVSKFSQFLCACTSARVFDNYSVKVHMIELPVICRYLMQVMLQQCFSDTTSKILSKQRQISTSNVTRFNG